MRYLRQSTIVTVTVGPFLDSTDGVTPENGLAGTMTVQVAKAGAAFGARNSATAITFDADGFYRVALSATDTDTGGPLMIKSLVAGAAPVWHEFTIMAAARYDLAILGSGVQPVNVTQWNSATVATPAVAGYPVVTNKVGTGTGELNLTAGTITANVVDISDAAVDELLDRPIAEPSAIWAWPGSLRKILGFIGALSRNKITQTNTLQSVRNDADGANIATSTHGDDGSVHTRGEFS